MAIAARHPWPQILVSGHGKDDYLGLIKDLVSAAHAGAPLDLRPHFDERSCIRTVSSFRLGHEIPGAHAGEIAPVRPGSRHTFVHRTSRDTLGAHARPPQGRRPLPPRASQSRSRTSGPGIRALPLQRRAPIVSRTTPSSLSQGSPYVVIRDATPSLSQHCGSDGLSAARVESGSQGVGDHAASCSRSGRLAAVHRRRRSSCTAPPALRQRPDQAVCRGSAIPANAVVLARQSIHGGSASVAVASGKDDRGKRREGLSNSHGIAEVTEVSRSIRPAARSPRSLRSGWSIAGWLPDVLDSHIAHKKEEADCRGLPSPN